MKAADDITRCKLVRNTRKEVADMAKKYVMALAVLVTNVARADSNVVSIMASACIVGNVKRARIKALRAAMRPHTQAAVARADGRPSRA